MSEWAYGNAVVVKLLKGSRLLLQFPAGTEHQLAWRCVRFKQRVGDYILKKWRRRSLLLFVCRTSSRFMRGEGQDTICDRCSSTVTTTRPSQTCLQSAVSSSPQSRPNNAIKFFLQLCPLSAGLGILTRAANLASLSLLISRSRLVVLPWLRKLGEQVEDNI